MTRQRLRHVTYLWLLARLLCVQCDVTTGYLETRLVDQVTCTYHNESLIVLKLQDTATGTTVWYNTHSHACGSNFSFSGCSPSSDYVSVKAVITDLQSHPRGTRVLTCQAVLLQGQGVVTKHLGSVTVTRQDATSTGPDTTLTSGTQTLTTGSAVTAGPVDETNTSGTSGRSSSADQRFSDTPDTPDTPGDTTGSQGQHDTPDTRDTPGDATGSQGQHDTPDTSPLTVWMLGALSAGLVLLVALAALLAVKLNPTTPTLSAGSQRADRGAESPTDPASLTTAAAASTTPTSTTLWLTSRMSRVGVSILCPLRALSEHRNIRDAVRDEERERKYVHRNYVMIWSYPACILTVALTTRAPSPPSSASPSSELPGIHRHPSSLTPKVGAVGVQAGYLLPLPVVMET
ncbi:hypothetical protein C0Q70_12655 [Pomacea canaliculata]|uniref:ZP domain-containing protein n=1 Tax=Pomacea canaliculata TaxID=400727 RepID=A0A2T7P257_POMCA|nr:hypothetical protein C0Q70_12655 [Pomacea canaliculata]